MDLAQTVVDGSALSLWDGASLVGSVTSVVLAIIAILVTLKLYEMSNVITMQTKEAVGSIIANVAKLEEFFRTFHAETFRAYQADRDKVWALVEAGRAPGGGPEGEVEQKAELARISEGLQYRFDEALKKLQTEGDIRHELEAFKSQVRKLIAEGVSKGQEVAKTDYEMDRVHLWLNRLPDLLDEHTYLSVNLQDPFIRRAAELLAEQGMVEWLADKKKDGWVIMRRVSHQDREKGPDGQWLPGSEVSSLNRSVQP